MTNKETIMELATLYVTASEEIKKALKDDEYSNAVSQTIGLVTFVEEHVLKNVLMK